LIQPFSFLDPSTLVPPSLPSSSLSPSLSSSVSQALLNLPTNIGVTANISINYRAPTRADQYVIIRTNLTELKGRKAIVAATMEDLKGQRLADCTCVSSSLFPSASIFSLLALQSSLIEGRGEQELKQLVSDFSDLL
jgi:hypothetical protein